MNQAYRFALAFLLGSLSAAVVAQEQAPRPPTESVIQPDVERRDVVLPRIDTEDLEVGGYFGILSVEDFGANPVIGARVVYHLSEDYFVEGIYGTSTVSDEALCRLGLCLFPSRKEDLTYYSLSAGFNFFPGEVFIGKRRAMTSAVYVLAGAGNTSFLNEDRFTINVGIGIRVLPVDWMALHITVRDFLFESDVLGTNKITNNFELTAGFSIYF
mgnify:CR=1 FL=1